MLTNTECAQHRKSENASERRSSMADELKPFISSTSLCCASPLLVEEDHCLRCLAAKVCGRWTMRSIFYGNWFCNSICSNWMIWKEGSPLDPFLWVLQSMDLEMELTYCDLGQNRDSSPGTWLLSKCNVLIDSDGQCMFERLPETKANKTQN